MRSLRDARHSLREFGRPTSCTCANCSATLVATFFEGTEIDLCPECLGVFMDRGELDRYLSRAPTPIQIPGVTAYDTMGLLDCVVGILEGS
jgi:hypothetical protein